MEGSELEHKSLSLKSKQITVQYSPHSKTASIVVFNVAINDSSFIPLTVFFLLSGSQADFA